MAPPSPRRPGFSRRAQYGLFAGYVVAVAGALLGFLLLVTARLDPAGHSAIQSFLADLFSPVSSGSRAVVRSAKSLLEDTDAYFDAASKNKAMAIELRSARLKLIQAQANALENARLKSLLGIASVERVSAVAAPLISSIGASSRRFATLAAGAGSGVRAGQPVRGPDGLVGQVVQTGRLVSRILLITDTSSVVPVKRVRDGMPALAVGTGNGGLEIRPISNGGTGFGKGDTFVTSGTGGVYRPNIPVAIAVRDGHDLVLARPLADPAALDFALVEPVFAPEPLPAPIDAAVRKK
jgi:rod shape-determining protein MreC